jgi:hypothetical protein
MKLINILFFLVLCLATFSNLTAQSIMLMTEYDAQLQAWKAREDSARLKIHDGQINVAAVKQEIQEAEAENLTVWQEIYKLVEADEAGVSGFRQQIETLKQEVDTFRELPTEDQKKNQLELNRKISHMHKSKMGALTDVHERLGELEKKMVIINLMLR